MWSEVQKKNSKILKYFYYLKLLLNIFCKCNLFLWFQSWIFGIITSVKFQQWQWIIIGALCEKVFTAHLEFSVYWLCSECHTTMHSMHSIFACIEYTDNLLTLLFKGVGSVRIKNNNKTFIQQKFDFDFPFMKWILKMYHGLHKNMKQYLSNIGFWKFSVAFTGMYVVNYFKQLMLSSRQCLNGRNLAIVRCSHMVIVI